jgi:hypothetical protein
MASGLFTGKWVAREMRHPMEELVINRPFSTISREI